MTVKELILKLKQFKSNDNIEFMIPYCNHEGNVSIENNPDKPGYIAIVAITEY